MENCITIQLKKEEIWLKIAKQAEQTQIIEALKKKINELKKLYQDEKTPIRVTGKILKNKEMEEIQSIITEAIDVKVYFNSPKTLGRHGITEAFQEEIKTSDTIFQKGSMRSGQRVEHEGSIVVLGDVNAGAEVIAGENIIILGELRGLAHAGAKGNRKAIIATNKIDCPQIRIADKIKEFEKNTEQSKKSFAYINEQNEMIVE